MKYTLFLLLVLCIFLSCSTPLPRSANTITATIEGLKPDDKIWVVVNDTFFNGWIVTDTITVTTKNEFTYSTLIKDKPVYLSYIPAERVNDPEYLNINGNGVEIFLEGYADISLSGNVAEWEAIYPEGGLYLIPDMQPVSKAVKELRILHSQFQTLLASGEEYAEDSTEIKRKLSLIMMEAVEKERQLLSLKRTFYQKKSR
ncbi:MAG: hypothetical protein LUE93_08835 [Bacteroides sp.]|nr:hypothetical protein [Bacteroides sp.]